jgi:hypothetical protein
MPFIFQHMNVKFVQNVSTESDIRGCHYHNTHCLKWRKCYLQSRDSISHCLSYTVIHPLKYFHYLCFQNQTHSHMECLCSPSDTFRFVDCASLSLILTSLSCWCLNIIDHHFSCFPSLYQSDFTVISHILHDKC